MAAFYSVAFYLGAFSNTTHQGGASACGGNDGDGAGANASAGCGAAERIEIWVW
jgi:hypothetical protein